jgi:hypothetical protein
MKRIVIALVALLGFSGAVFADMIDVTTQNGRAKFSSAEATSYVASHADQGQYQVFNP